MTFRATITSKGQITIPVDVRRLLGVKNGDAVDFEVADGKATLTPRPRRSFVDLVGIGRSHVRNEAALALPWPDVKRLADQARTEELSRKADAGRE